MKKVIVYLPDEVRRASPSPQGEAQQLASQVLRLEIVNDPWDFESTEVDLSNYATPNLVSSNGSKAWYNYRLRVSSRLSRYH